MDESWRIPIGSLIPSRRSTGQSTKLLPRAAAGAEPALLDADDFRDVFGGAPRTVLLRQFSSGDVTPVGAPRRRASFCEDVFRESESGFPARNGRNLPYFPATTAAAAAAAVRVRTEEGFFDDIFGSRGGGGDRRSRTRSWKSKSKSNSSSVLSSEDLSPLRPSIAEDPALSSFASKLRPITIPSRLNSPSPKLVSGGKPRSHQTSSVIHPPYMDFHIDKNGSNSLFQPSLFELSRQYSSPPDSITLDPNSYQSIKMSFNDSDVESPSSVISSAYQIPMATIIRTQDKALKELQKEVVLMLEESEEEEAECSYVIEIASDRRKEMEGDTTVDEAIAWAAEKFRIQMSKEVEVGDEHQHSSKMTEDPLNNKESFAEREEGMEGLIDRLEQVRNGFGNTPVLRCIDFEEPEEWDADERTHPSPEDQQMQLATELLEEDIKLWSADKQGNIRSLLSTLDYILWPGSGWKTVPLRGLIEPANVKKTYQKARLCFHPDKMQQKGATFQQKYVAEKVFTILQDAWSVFISQDVFSY